MEAQKAKTLKETSTQPVQSSAPNTESLMEAKELSINKIKMMLPALHGRQANFNAHVQRHNTYKDTLDTFYNGKNFKFK
ncbi:hypothetical protein BG006_007232 [Podila minutissima]|uniref:Uncharacterized protein n=1 Tax=Podila minutissima TaxID=64525 RepID=A0A9P5VKU7_9FUNG|nr:hypothetical protein BG006_007232 [Podila minutissima]